eukprot:7838071-Karenia_brevis.AAC.1
MKGSDGVAERAAQEIEGRVRSILFSLVEGMNRDISAKQRIVVCIPAYAACLYKRLYRGDDGKVAYEKVKGEKPSV